MRDARAVAPSDEGPPTPRDHQNDQVEERHACDIVLRWAEACQRHEPNRSVDALQREAGGWIKRHGAANVLPILERAASDAGRPYPYVRAALEKAFPAPPPPKQLPADADPRWREAVEAMSVQAQVYAHDVAFADQGGKITLYARTRFARDFITQDRAGDFVDVFKRHFGDVPSVELVS